TFGRIQGRQPFGRGRYGRIGGTDLGQRADGGRTIVKAAHRQLLGAQAEAPRQLAGGGRQRGGAQERIVGDADLVRGATGAQAARDLVRRQRDRVRGAALARGRGACGRYPRGSIEQRPRGVEAGVVGQREIARPLRRFVECVEIVGGKRGDPAQRLVQRRRRRAALDVGQVVQRRQVVGTVA